MEPCQNEQTTFKNNVQTTERAQALVLELTCPKKEVLRTNKNPSNGSKVIKLPEVLQHSLGKQYTQDCS